MLLIFYGFLLLKCIEALNLSDLGLPNSNQCAFGYNQTLYILGDSHHVSITFQDPWNRDPPNISIRNSTSPRIITCAITRSGRLILLPSSQSIQVFDTPSTIISSWQPNQRITYAGSQNAIDRFTTTANKSTNLGMVAFNDYVLIQDQNTTFILDARFSTQWTWYELGNTSSSTLNPPLLAATSRWILYFRTEHRNTTDYVTYVDCFDPYTFLWLGTAATINSTNTTFTHTIPLSSSVEGRDSLLLIGTTNEFWRLDISTWVYNDVRMTAIPSTKEEPVRNGTVTRVTTDLVVFYGGSIDQQSASNISFFNATSLAFLPQPQWLVVNETQMGGNTTDSSHGNSNNNLPIILGSVMGGLLFIAIIALLVWCMLRRKRSQNGMRHQNHQQTHENLWACWPFLHKKSPMDRTIPTSK